MPSLKYRSALTEPLAPLGCGSHKLDGVRFCWFRSIAFRGGILNRRLSQWVNRRDVVQNSKIMGSVFIAKCNTLPYGSKILLQQLQLSVHGAHHG